MCVRIQNKQMTDFSPSKGEKDREKKNNIQYVSKFQLLAVDRNKENNNPQIDDETKWNCIIGNGDRLSVVCVFVCHRRI